MYPCTLSVDTHTHKPRLLATLVIPFWLLTFLGFSHKCTLGVKHLGILPGSPPPPPCRAPHGTHTNRGAFLGDVSLFRPIICCV